MNEILQWIDLIWLPIGVIFVHRQHRLLAAGFFIACTIMLRMQVELMDWIGYGHGVLSFWNLHALPRGMLIYSIFYALYLILAQYSPGTKPIIFLAASITIFFAALFTSMIMMVL